MKEFIAYLVKNLVEHPDEVKVNVVDGEKRTIIEVEVAPEDVSRVVGRKGRTVNALRTIALTLGARLGRSVRLEVIN